MKINRITTELVANAILGAIKCKDGEHVFEYEHIDGTHIFCCADCGYSVIPGVNIDELPSN